MEYEASEDWKRIESLTVTLKAIIALSFGAAAIMTYLNFEICCELLRLL
jgi:hypothetical protein